MVPPVALGDLSTDEQSQPVSADPALQRPCRAINSSKRSIARLVRVSAAWVKQADIIDGTRRVTTNLTTKREDRWRKQAICAEHIADSGTPERPRVFHGWSAIPLEGKGSRRFESAMLHPSFELRAGTLRT